MLKLSRHFSILGNNCPAVLKQTTVTTAKVNHWFNSKCHSRFHLRTSTTFTNVNNLRLFMKLTTDTMAAILFHYSVTMISCNLLNYSADITNATAWTDLLNPSAHALISHINQLFNFIRYTANEVSLVGITMELIKISGYINIKDVPIAQNILL